MARTVKVAVGVGTAAVARKPAVAVARGVVGTRRSPGVVAAVSRVTAVAVNGTGVAAATVDVTGSGVVEPLHPVSPMTAHTTSSATRDP